MVRGGRARLLVKGGGAALAGGLVGCHVLAHWDADLGSRGTVMLVWVGEVVLCSFCFLFFFFAYVYWWVEVLLGVLVYTFWCLLASAWSAWGAQSALEILRNPYTRCLETFRAA